MNIYLCVALLAVAQYLLIALTHAIFSKKIRKLSHMINIVGRRRSKQDEVLKYHESLKTSLVRSFLWPLEFLRHEDDLDTGK
jgi:hypothetical protein